MVVAAALAAAGVVAVQSRTPAPTPAPPPVDYVALGDSFSAGPLVPDARSDPPGCFRSTNNYPAYLAGYLGVRSYRDVTCSGAQTRDLQRPQQLAFGQTAPAQLDALSAGTDLVTVGIGGNDFGLFGSIVGTCGALRDRDPRGAPCRRSFTRRIDGRPVDTKARDARRVEDRVARVLRAVARRAPEADVYVVGYPRLLPERGRCAAVSFAAGDYPWGRRVERLLNDSLSAAAERSGATFVDLYPASLGTTPAREAGPGSTGARPCSDWPRVSTPSRRGCGGWPGPSTPPSRGSRPHGTQTPSHRRDRWSQRSARVSQTRN